MREAGRLATTATSPAGDRRLCTLAYKARIVSKLDAIRPPLWQWLEGRVASTVELGRTKARMTLGSESGPAPTARSRSSNSSDVAYVARWSASGSSLRASRVTGHRRANPCTHLVDLERDLRPTPASPAIPGDLIRVHASVSGGTALSTSPSRRCPRLAIANVTEITATARVLYSAYKLS